ncbi:MAG: MmcQ/YjbR family DNA-binding protein [Prolixibacteraceae bacterium]|nr:MmcQ/YjbR family DNA-binding protein [Prolixibacteraceae bacterium]
MNAEEIREFCLSFPGVTESFPFDDTSLVFKVMNKMFCLMSLGGNLSVSLKNRPEKVVGLQEHYPFVLPAYHFNKIHWLRVEIDYATPSNLLRLWIRESYEIVVEGLSKKLKEELKNIQEND